MEYSLESANRIGLVLAKNAETRPSETRRLLVSRPKVDATNV